jgi:serine phosphatase RsbU (regulator of sigma subunit)
VSEVIDILNEIRKVFESIEQGCSDQKKSSDCRKALSAMESKLERALELVTEHERRDTMIDRLYHSLGAKLNTTYDQNELLASILDSLRKIIGYDAAGIFLVDHEAGAIISEVIRGYEEERRVKVHQKLGEGILGWVIAHSKSQIVPDVSQDARYIEARSLTRSEMAVPLISEGTVIGCLNLESDKLCAYNNEDLFLLETYATQASIAVARARLQRELQVKQRMEDELALARKIQASLLPNEPPFYSGCAIMGLNVPSSEVGGDYFDFISLESKKLGLAIADVAGKGLAAALTMAGFRAALRSEARHSIQPPQVMHKVNHFVHESAPGSFVTAFYGILSGWRLNYVNAGHNPPILLHEDGEYELLETGGLVLGFEEEQYFEGGEAMMSPGDTVLFYTDGVTEAQNTQEEEYGLPRLLEQFRRTQKLAVETQIDAIHRSVLAFACNSEPQDDLTLMIVKC